jgi:Flp pilus assembly protein TadG
MMIKLKRKLTGKVRSFTAATAGVALIEFAAIAPLLMLMTFGTLEIGRAIMVHKRFQRATAMVGDLVAREKCVTAVDLTGIARAAGHVMWPYDTAPLKFRVHSISIPSNAGPNESVGIVEWGWAHNGMSKSEAGDPKSLPSAGLVVAGNTGVMVEAEYDYTPLLLNLIPAVSTTRSYVDTVVNAPREARQVDLSPTTRPTCDT